MLHDLEQTATSLGILSKGRQAFDKPLEGLSALLKLGPVVRGWRLSLAQRLHRAFGDDEAVKCALGANILYWHDDPDTLWWILFAVAQGGYIGSGGRYIQGGSQRLSNALAKAFKAAGGELLLRRTVTEILLDGEGRPIGVAHEGKDGDGRVEARAAGRRQQRSARARQGHAARDAAHALLCALRSPPALHLAVLGDVRSVVAPVRIGLQRLFDLPACRSG